jgi:hypothetical protein
MNEKDLPMGMRHLNAYASRCTARALDAAQLRSFVGFKPSIETEGQRLPSRLESPR